MDETMIAVADSICDQISEGAMSSNGRQRLVFFHQMRKRVVPFLNNCVLHPISYVVKMCSYEIYLSTPVIHATTPSQNKHISLMR